MRYITGYARQCGIAPEVAVTGEVYCRKLISPQYDVVIAQNRSSVPAPATFDFPAPSLAIYAEEHYPAGSVSRVIPAGGTEVFLLAKKND